MKVTFERTGPRRYGVRITVAGQPQRYVHPAPGYDDHIPHDLVHYLVEAELHLKAGVFGRAARGGSTFIVASEGASARERTRAQRKQRKRESRLDERDNAADGDMARAERIAILCDVAWRRSQGQNGALRPWLAPPAPAADEAIVVQRILTKLDPIAARWHALPVGGSLQFEWPATQPKVEQASS